MARNTLTAWAVAAAMLFGASAPAAARDLNYFDMLREQDNGRAVVVGVSFRLGGEREQEAPRLSLGFSADRAREYDAIDVSLYRFAPREELSAAVVFADEAAPAAPPAAAVVIAKPARLAAAKASVAAKPQRAKAKPVQLAAAPKAKPPAQAGLQKVLLLIDNPHAGARPHTDI